MNMPMSTNACVSTSHKGTFKAIRWIVDGSSFPHKVYATRVVGNSQL